MLKLLKDFINEKKDLWDIYDYYCNYDNTVEELLIFIKDKNLKILNIEKSYVVFEFYKIEGKHYNYDSKKKCLIATEKEANELFDLFLKYEWASVVYNDKTEYNIIKCRGCFNAAKSTNT